MRSRIAILDQQFGEDPYLPWKMLARRAVALTKVITEHAGGSGIAYLWEQQLLNTPVPVNAR